MTGIKASFNFTTFLHFSPFFPRYKIGIFIDGVRFGDHVGYGILSLRAPFHHLILT